MMTHRIMSRYSSMEILQNNYFNSTILLDILCNVVNLEDGGEVFLTSLPKTIHILYSTRIFTLNQHRINMSRTGGARNTILQY